MAEKWWLHHRRITLHAVQLGQYFFEFPAAWPFHVDLEIGELVVKPMKQKPILYGRSLFEVILCCTSGFKANCMHQSLLSCSKNGLGPADRSNHKSVIKSQFPQLSWQRWLRNDGCIIAESHCMLYNWVSISTNSLQLDLSMLTLKLVNWWSNRWKKSQYYTAGACLKWFYAAHQVLKLIVCIKACFLAQRMALDRPIDQTIKVSLNPSFHNFLGKDGWEMMVASSPNHTACCTTGSVFLRIPCSLTFPCWPWNWWIGQNHEKIANTIRPEPV